MSDSTPTTKITSDYRPRLSAELTPESATKLFAILPHGWQKPLFQTLVHGIIELYDKEGINAISAIVTGAINVELVAKFGLEGKKKEVENED